MAAMARRGLSPDFLADLQGGLLAPLRERVARDQSLCLELREDYINVYYYYRGGNVMRVSRANGGYSAFFDTKYSQGVVRPRTRSAWTSRGSRLPLTAAPYARAATHTCVQTRPDVHRDPASSWPLASEHLRTRARGPPERPDLVPFPRSAPERTRRDLAEYPFMRPTRLSR